jgi:NAD(P)-dependent dehydrogenase (short-subunit alcohol dehydrogenase family)
MANIFITGASAGLGLAAARMLLKQGHSVVPHARNERRASVILDALPGVDKLVVGDLSSVAEICGVADQVNSMPRFDAIIHNAGIGYREPRKITTVDGNAHVFAINSLAPYLLTALVTRPDRLVYLGSSVHRDGTPDVSDVNWMDRRWDGAQAYADSKLFVVVLAFAVARLWPAVLSNSVDPGWVATKMGGPGASHDLSRGHVTQSWLVTSTDTEALVSGAYFYHQRQQESHPATQSVEFQDSLLGKCAELTGVQL